MVQQALDPLTGAERDHVFVSPEDAPGWGWRRRALRARGGSAGGPWVAPGTLQGHWPR
jgi:hypothetical protein